MRVCVCVLECVGVCERVCGCVDEGISVCLSLVTLPASVYECIGLHDLADALYSCCTDDWGIIESV